MEPLETAQAIAKAAEVASNGDLQFFALAFAFAAGAGLVRTHRDKRYRDFWNLLSTGIVSGFIGMGCVLMLSWASGGRAGHELGLLAAAIFIGLMGKEADKFYPQIIEKVLKRLGFEFEEPLSRPKRKPK